MGAPAAFLMPRPGVFLSADRLAATRLPLAWAPPTACGLNIVAGSFWNGSVAAGQYQALLDYGVSFVRSMFFAYQLKSYGPGAVDAAVQPVLAAEPYGADPTQLVLSADFTYAVPAGDPVVLSAPVTYGAATLPAGTLLTVTGSSAGIYTGRVFTTPGTVRVAAGTSLADTGPVAFSGAAAPQLLHRNFYKAPGQARTPIPQYVAQAAAWLAAGFCFDHGGYASNWSALFQLFGQANVEPMREQEWAYFAGQDWDPRRVLISDENEAGWPGLDARQQWASWQPYFQDVLYPRLRFYFPAHTLGFGFPDYCRPEASGAIGWWPDDGNTLLRIHGYLDRASSMPYDGTSRSDLDAFFAWLGATARRLGIPRVYLQEFGLPDTDAECSQRLMNLRQSVQALGWPAAVWGGDDVDSRDPYVSARLLNGIWIPNTSCAGAFGLD